MVEIRDRRHAAWFWMDKAILDTYAPTIGPAGIAVYAMLARHADAKGQAFPSIRTMAKTLCLGHSTILRTIDLLEHYGLIEKETRETEYGDKSSNIYTLLNIGVSIQEHQCFSTGTGGVTTGTGVFPNEEQGGVTTGTEQDPINKIQENKRESRARATLPLPPDFPVTEKMREWAKTNSPSTDLDRDHAVFCDKALAKDWRYKDWPAAWRQYMRDPYKFGQPPMTNGKDPTPASTTPCPHKNVIFNPDGTRHCLGCGKSAPAVLEASDVPHV